MKGGDFDEKDDDRIRVNGSDALCQWRICSRSNQNPIEGSDKNYLSNRNPGPDSHPRSAKEPEHGPDPN